MNDLRRIGDAIDNILKELILYKNYTIDNTRKLEDIDNKLADINSKLSSSQDKA